jgi:hypothetical protein
MLKRFLSFVTAAAPVLAVVALNVIAAQAEKHLVVSVDPDRAPGVSAEPEMAIPPGPDLAADKYASIRRRNGESAISVAYYALYETLNNGNGPAEGTAEHTALTAAFSAMQRAVLDFNTSAAPAPAPAPAYTAEQVAAMQTNEGAADALQYAGLILQDWLAAKSTVGSTEARAVEMAFDAITNAQNICLDA